MTLAFDPFKIPRQFVEWLASVSEEQRDRHTAIFASRAHAAHGVLKAVNELKNALTVTNDPRIREKVDELIELARDLHDYDPTSD